MYLMHCPHCDRPLVFGRCITHNEIAFDEQIQVDYDWDDGVNQMLRKTPALKQEVDLNEYYWPA